MTRPATLLCFLALQVACGPGPTTELGTAWLEEDVRATRRFDALTPTGERIFQASLQWMDEQVEHPEYPRKRMCAINVSHVLEMAGITAYSDDAVVEVVGNVEAQDGLTVLLPRDKPGMIAALNTLYGGRPPVGALVAGCKRSSCWVSPGDAHVGIVGDVDAAGNVLVYHNNWYRPDNAGGVWREHMVSRHFYYELGLRRQWMPTPWLRFTRDETGQIVDLVSVLPAIDDMDPLQYHLRVAVPLEIVDEMAEAVSTDGLGGVTPLLLELEEPEEPEEEAEAP